MLQCSKIGGITDREKGRQFWAVSDDDHQKSLSVQHKFFKRLEMTSLKITKERLEAQVEYEAWEQSDRRKKFDPAKAKLLSFRCRSMWNFLRCVPADFFAGARLHCRLIGQQTYELYNLFPLMTDALWDDLEQNIRPPAPQDVQITVCYLNFLFVTVLMLS